MKARCCTSISHVAIFDHGKPVPIPDDVGGRWSPVFLLLHTHTPDASCTSSRRTSRRSHSAISSTSGASRSARRRPVPNPNRRKRRRGVVDGRRTRRPRNIELTQHLDVTSKSGRLREARTLHAWNGKLVCSRKVREHSPFDRLRTGCSPFGHPPSFVDIFRTPSSNEAAA